MNEMIERVARAICIAEEMDPDSMFDAADPKPLWQVYIPLARAAIEAMREPSNKMVDYVWQTKSEGMDPRRVWHAMIGAAVRE